MKPKFFQAFPFFFGAFSSSTHFVVEVLSVASIASSQHNILCVDIAMPPKAARPPKPGSKKALEAKEKKKASSNGDLAGLDETGMYAAGLLCMHACESCA